MLSLMTFFPLLGMVVVLVPCRTTATSGSAGRASSPRRSRWHLGIVLFTEFRPDDGGACSSSRMVLDPAVRHQLLHGCRWAERPDGAPDGAALLPVHLRLLGNRDGVKGYFAMFLFLETGMLGRLLLARLLPLLHLLGSRCCCRCTSSSESGAARTRSTPRSSSSSIPCSDRS